VKGTQVLRLVVYYISSLDPVVGTMVKEIFIKIGYAFKGGILVLQRGLV
jgi:hypothetical protein